MKEKRLPILQLSPDARAELIEYAFANGRRDKTNGGVIMGPFAMAPPNPQTPKGRQPLQYYRDRMGDDTVFIPVPWRTKGPRFKGWPNTKLADTRDPAYEQDCETGNLGVLTGPVSDHLVSIDFDEQRAWDLMVSLNPLFAQTFQTKGERPGVIHLRLKGEYPVGLFKLKWRADPQAKDSPVEWRATNICQMIAGLHENGLDFYTVLNDHPVLELRYEDIVWPGEILRPDESEPAEPLPDWLYPRPVSKLSDKLPPQVIKGLLYRSARLVIGGAPKSKKSFLMQQLSYCVANNLPFLGKPTDGGGGKCLHVDLELFEAECRQRFKEIEKALGAGSADNVEVISLRGKTRQLKPEHFEQLAELVARQGYVLTSFDPIYKLMPGKDERAGVDVQPILATLEEFGDTGNCSVIYSQHFTKGNQALKSAMDRISGSNYFVRDADLPVIVTELREPNTYVVDIVQRSFEDVKSFGVRFTYPIFERDDSIDITQIREPGKGKADSDPVTERMLTALHVADADGGLSYSDWFKAVQVKGRDSKLTPSETTFKRRLRILTKPGGPVFKSALEDKYALSPGYAQYRANFNGQGSP